MHQQNQTKQLNHHNELKADIPRKVSTACGANNPQQLWSTSLRKYITVLSPVMNLPEFNVLKL